MTKISISILAFLVCGILSQVVFAGNDAADADAIFRAATALQQTIKTPTDPELIAALDDLKKLVDDGNRHLLNQKVKKATAVAQLVSAQMELVRLLEKVAELKERLRVLQTDANSLAQEKAILQNKHERLTLMLEGRALSGAYPAPAAETDTVSPNSVGGGQHIAPDRETAGGKPDTDDGGDDK